MTTDKQIAFTKWSALKYGNNFNSASDREAFIAGASSQKAKDIKIVKNGVDDFRDIETDMEAELLRDYSKYLEAKLKEE